MQGIFVGKTRFVDSASLRIEQGRLLKIITQGAAFSRSVFHSFFSCLLCLTIVSLMYLFFHVVSELAYPLLVILLNSRRTLHRIIPIAILIKLCKRGNGCEVILPIVVQFSVIDEVAKESFLDEGLEIGPK